MERAGALINRLQEQYQQNAGADKMLVTLHILAAELELEKSKMVLKGKGVSVVAPTYVKSRAAVVEEPIEIPVVQVAKPVVPFADDKPKPVQVVVEEAKPPVQPKPQPINYDPMQDIPTLAAQKPHNDVVELNEIMGRKVESLNERLKTANVELGSVLQSSPIRDLKKAIGINDRYVFLNELFKGDEAMYERSIKTINSFTIFGEAEYWIKRELKLKLGWNEESAAVTQFDQLVRRRFS
jgi:hypothetical protein